MGGHTGWLRVVYLASKAVDWIRHGRKESLTTETFAWSYLQWIGNLNVEVPRNAAPDVRFAPTLPAE